MSIVITKDVTSYFFTEDVSKDVSSFHSVALSALELYGYYGMSVPDNDLTQAEFSFYTEDEMLADTALTSLLSSHSSSSSLSLLKLEIFEKINSYRDSWLGDRFPYDGKRWDCDMVSVINVIGFSLKTLGSGLAPDEVFRTYDNANIPVNAAYVHGLADALFTFRKSCYFSSWVHKYYVGIQPTVEAVLAYDYTVGWPAKDPA